MTEKPRWQDLSTQAKMRIIAMGAIQISLLIAALWDIRRRPIEEIRGNRRMWMAASFINFVGPIAYFVFGRKPMATTLEEVPTAA